MTTEERVWTLLVEANPIPEVGASDPEEIDIATHLATLEERSSEMVQVDTESKAEQRRRRGKTRWLAAAAVLVAIVGAVALVISQRMDDKPLAEATDTVIAFMEARNNHDAEAMASLYTADANVGLPWISTPSQFGTLAEFEKAVEKQLVALQCFDPQSTPQGFVKVVCIYRVELAWTRALGIDPVRHTSTFTMNDGAIQSLSLTAAATQVASMQRGFVSWLETSHPDDVRKMFQEEGLFWKEIITDETVELFEQYTEEFVAETTGG